MTGQSSILRDNLQEIEHAVRNRQGCGLRLVANFFGNRIYDSSRGWGRLWVWFYRFVDWVQHKNNDLRLDRLKQAIVNTHNLFQSQLPQIENHIASYESYLRQAGSGYSVLENQFHAARSAIIFWNQSYAPFLRLMKQVNCPKLEKLFRLSFEGRSSQSDAAVLWANPFAEQLKAFQKVIDVEGLSCGPLPLEVFKKILRKKPLNSIDNKNLDRWIGKISKVPGCVNRVHGMLLAVATRYSKAGKEDGKHADWVVLEAFLEDKGCSVFQQQDPKHILWQQALKKGMILSQGDEEFVLAHEILPSASGSENTRVFALEKPSAQVLLAPQNKTALAIRRFRGSAGNGFAVEPAKILGIFDDGRWGTMERLQPLGSRKWASAFGSLSPEDISLVNVLAGLLEWLVKKNCTPSNFSSKTIMFDAQYRLKALKLTEKREFDFNALEDFALECSAGNAAVFQYLMSTSGMAKHPVANFYYELISHAFRGDETAVEDLASIYKIGDPKVVDRGTALVQEALALRSQICMKIREERPDQDPKAIKKAVGSTILSCYASSKGCGILWPSLGKVVLNKCADFPRA